MNPPLPPDGPDSGEPSWPSPDRSTEPRAPTELATAESSALGTAARLDGILVGNWRGTRLLVGWSWPALVAVVLGAAWAFRSRPGDGDLPMLAVLLLVAALLGSLIQSLLRLWIGRRKDRVLEQLTLTAIGYRVVPRGSGLAAPGNARLWLAAGPTLALLLAGLLLTMVVGVAGSGSFGWGAALESGGPELAGRVEPAAAARIVAWVWLTQAVLMGLPIPGSMGRQILWALVERLGPQRNRVAATAPTATAPAAIRRRVDRLQGTIAALLAAAAVWQWQRETIEIGMPAWPFLLALSILVWAGRGGGADRATRETDIGTESDRGTEPHQGSWRARRKSQHLSWWNRFRIRRVQRAERGEAIDATRLDAVLDRLHRDGFDSLSAAERSILRRVSQRLRQNRNGPS